MAKKNEIEQLEIDLKSNRQKRDEFLNAKYKELENILNDEFYEYYDFSDSSHHLKFLGITKKLQYPQTIETKVDKKSGKEIKSIKRKNYSHNAGDRNTVLNSHYVNFMMKRKSGLGKPSGTDSINIPIAEYKTVKISSSSELFITPNLKIGVIDKVDEKVDGMHNIYNSNSGQNLIAGIFEENSLVPIIIFMVGSSSFQKISTELIKENAKRYELAQTEIAAINEKIKNKEFGYRVGDKISLSHLKKEREIDGNIIQVIRDTTELVIGDFIFCSDLEIIHIDENWKSKIVIDSEISNKCQKFMAEIKQYYRSEETINYREKKSYKSELVDSNKRKLKP